MPRKPQENNRCNCNDEHYDYMNEFEIDDAIDLKLQVLQTKLSAEIDEKQDKLIAGKNIKIEGNVISAEKTPEPEPPVIGAYVYFFDDDYIPEEID